MAEDKKPLDDLKEGLGLIFKAAKGAVEKLPTDKAETFAKDAVKDLGKVFDSLGNEVDKAWQKATGSQPPAEPKPAEAKKPAPPFDDAYGPEPTEPKGPRVG